MAKLSRDEVFAYLRALVVARLDVELDEVQEDKSLVNDLKADSLDVVEQIMEVEEMFGTGSIPDAVAAEWENIGDITSYVYNNQPDDVTEKVKQYLNDSKNKDVVKVLNPPAAEQAS